MQRRQIREQDRIAKKAEKEEAKNDKQAAQQLKKDLRCSKRASKVLNKASSPEQQAVVAVQSDEEGNGDGIRPVRPRRQIRAPGYLKGYDLSV